MTVVASDTPRFKTCQEKNRSTRPGENIPGVGVGYGGNALLVQRKKPKVVIHEL